MTTCACLLSYICLPSSLTHNNPAPVYRFVTHAFLVVIELHAECYTGVQLARTIGEKISHDRARGVSYRSTSYFCVFYGLNMAWTGVACCY